MMTYITCSKPEYPWDKGCQEIEKYRMAILDDDVFFHITLILKTKNRSNPLSDYCDYISCYFTSLPQSLHLGWCHPALAAPADQRLRLAEDLPVHLLGYTSAVMLPA